MARDILAFQIAREEGAKGRAVGFGKAQMRGQGTRQEQPPHAKGHPSPLPGPCLPHTESRECEIKCSVGGCGGVAVEFPYMGPLGTTA